MRRFTAIAYLTIAASAIALSQVRTLHLDKNGSSIEYLLVHPLHKVEAKSKEAEATIKADFAKKEITDVTAQVDVSTFDSGNSNRDSHAMEVIDAIDYPQAEFKSDHVTMNGDSVKVTGRLTFHGVTNEVTMYAAAYWSSGKLDVKGAFDISLTAFKVERPALLMIPVEDKLRFTLQGTFD
jgi:polyisoprenoid-binding protein YceI